MPNFLVTDGQRRSLSTRLPLSGEHHEPVWKLWSRLIRAAARCLGFGSVIGDAPPVGRHRRRLISIDAAYAAIETFRGEVLED